MIHLLGALETTNTELAAALGAVGIPLRPGAEGIKLIAGDRGDRHCFFFQAQSACGLYQTNELIKAWNDDEWHRKHPEHPFAYIKMAFRSKSRLTDYVKKGVPTYVCQQGTKFAFLSLNASDALQKQVFAELKRP